MVKTPSPEPEPTAGGRDEKVATSSGFETIIFTGINWGFVLFFYLVYTLVVLFSFIPEASEDFKLPDPPLIYLPYVLAAIFPPRRRFFIGPEGIEYRYFGKWKAGWSEITSVRAHLLMIDKLSGMNPCVTVRSSNHYFPLDLFVALKAFSESDVRKIFLPLVKEGNVHNPNILIQDERGWLEEETGGICDKYHE